MENKKNVTMQLITRNNYEEFFLRYIDDELNAQQCKAVEEFVAENPDLNKELNFLKQFKLMPDKKLVFFDKESLLRTGNSGINTFNYEEYFLLYIDNELSTFQKQEVETFVLQHPQLQQEFILLKQTVLKPKNIQFTNKEVLYRQEKVERRVIGFRFARLAAAAAFIGVSILAWWLLSYNQSENIQVSKSDNVTPIEMQMPQIAKDNIQLQKQQDEMANKNSEHREDEKSAGKNIKPSPVKNKTFVAVHSPKKNTIKENEAVSENYNHEPLIVHQKLDVKDKIEEESDNRQSTADNSMSEPPQNEIAANNNKTTDTINAIPVDYKELNTTEDDRSLYVGNLNLNKDRVKNLLKKAGRLFGDKAREYADDDGKLQVANLQINSK